MNDSWIFRGLECAFSEKTEECNTLCRRCRCPGLRRRVTDNHKVEELQNTIVTSGASLHCYPSSFVNLTRVPSLLTVEQKGKIYSSCGCSVSFPDPYHFVQRIFDSHKHYSYFNLYFQVPVSGNYFISWPENVYSSSNALLVRWFNRKKGLWLFRLPKWPIFWSYYDF